MGDEMIGKTFGRLTVVDQIDDYVSPSGGKHKNYVCLCQCGRYTKSLKEHLISGRKKSCGCLRRFNGTKTHGGIRTRLYRIWSNMCNRCSNLNNPAWSRYGGRGISVCDEWKNYENFRDWAYSAGYKDCLTIDRIDNNQGYQPDNCRWVDDVQQANNKRNNRLVKYRGDSHTLAEWAKTLGVPYKTLHRRVVTLGWTIGRAFTQPLRPRSCNGLNKKDG